MILDKSENSLFFWLAFVFFFSGGIFKVFFPEVPFFHGQRLTFYVAFVFIFLAMITKDGRLAIKSIVYPFCIKKWLLLIVFLLSQFVAIYLSKDMGCQLVSNYFGVLALILLIILHAFTVFLALELAGIYSFIYALMALLFLDTLIVFMQMSYQFFPDFMSPVIDFFSYSLEARWSPELATESIHRFYIQGGSYIRTTWRINGLTEESPTHAILVAVAFLPFVLSAVITNYAFWRKDGCFVSRDKYLLMIILFIVGFILIASAATTAMIYLGFAVVCIWVGFYFVKSEILSISKFYIFVFFIGAVLGLGYLVAAKQALDERYNVNNNISILSFSKKYTQKITNNQNASNNSRLGLAVAELNIVANTNFFGAGRGCTKYYIAKALPSWTNNNFEIDIWKKNNHYPVLNQWTNLLAEYGIWGIGVLLWLFVFWLKSLYLFTNSKNFRVMFWSGTTVFFGIFAFLGMLSSLYWRQSIYLQMLFVLVWVMSKINLTRKQHVSD